MANQMIALGARAPQVDILGGTIQRNAQMLNMMMQQKAAERQSAKAEQEMALAQQTANLTAEEKRRAFRKADMEYLNNQLPGVKDDISWNRWLGELKKVDPGLSDDLRRRTGGRYIPEVVDIIGATAEQYLNKKVATPVASFQVSDQGVPQSVTAGGLEPSSKEIPQYRYVPDQPAAIPSAPPPPTEFDKAFGGGIPASPEMLDAAAEAIARGAGVNDPALKDLTAEQFNEANLRAGRMMLAKPISAEQGGVEPLTMENAPQIVQAALDSGFIDPVHVEQLKQMLPPENQAAVDQWVQQSGLKMQQSVPGARSAVYRPQQADFGAAVADDGMAFGGPRAPMAQQIGYEPTTTRFKSPTQAPETAIPGSAKVPLKRVREEAQAQRRSPQEIYQEKRTEKQAEADADFLEKYGAAKDAAQNTLSVINQMIGDLQVVNGQIKQGKRAPHGGFESVVGAGIPGLRFIPGTQSADFDALLDQIEGGAFLKAYESLKGTGQITEIEGQKATQALTRMRRSSSEVGFVKAAREFEGIIRRGMERAEQRKAALEGGAAPRATGTPTKRGRSVDELLKKYGG